MEDREFDLTIIRHSLTLAAGATLLLHFNFFWKKRDYFPHLCFFIGRAILFPLWLTRLTYILSFVFLLGISLSPPQYTQYFLLSQGLWGLFWMTLDENIWCPQLANFTTASFALLDKDLTALKTWSIFLYIYGGLQKLNFQFVSEGNGFVLFFNPLLEYFLDLRQLPKWLRVMVALGAGVGEVVMGLGLLFGVTQGIATKAIVVLHIVILLCVGPLGANFCHGIWPWNLMCIPMTLYVFNPGGVAVTEILTALSEFRPLVWISFFLWGCLPMMNFFCNSWSDEFSFKLHSLNFSHMMLFFANEQPEGLPLEFDRFVDGRGKIDIHQISRQYSQSPGTSLRSAKMWAQYLAEVVGQPILLVWINSPGILDGKRISMRFICCPGKKEI